MWSLTLREELGLRLSETTKVQSKIFGHERKDRAGGWGKLHNEEPHDLNFSPDISVIKLRRMSLPGHVACLEE
jgi:hypothetical protein